MDEQVRKTFDDLASGAPAGDLTGMSRKLLYACFEAGGDPDPERRLAALRVAANLDAEDQVRVVDPLMRDADARVRRYAFNLACAARQHGIEALRTAVNGDDVDLAVDALGLLVTQLDGASSMHARNWLRHEDPRIRAGAAMLLGNVSGPAMAVHLGRLAQTDPIAEVRTIAAEAVARCTGEEPKQQSKNHWEEGPANLDISLTPVEDGSAKAPKPIEPPTLPKPRGSDLSTIYPEDADRAVEEASAKGSADDAKLVPRAEDGEEEVREETPRDWREPAALPTALPNEPLALLKLYGMVRPEDRPTVMKAFQATDERLRSQALSSWSPGTNAVAGRGIALAVKALASKKHASMLRVMLREADAGVRAGAAEAIGTTGTLSMIPQLSNLLNDDDADVRLAAVRALTELLTRMERFAMLRDRITPLKNDTDAKVKAAAEETIAGLP